MADSKAKEISENILEKIGGKENVISVSYCATRLRLDVKDKNILNMEELKKIDGVIGIVEQNGQIQFILGPGTAGKVSTELKKLIGIKVEVEDEVKIRKEELKAKNNTPFKLFLGHIANIFIPLIPGFIGCGVLYGLSKLFSNLGWIDKNTYNILYVIGKSIFAYMNIIVGINAAKEFGGSPTLGGCIAGILSSSNLANIIIGGQKLVPGDGGIIAILIAVIFGAWFERKLRKVMPSIIDLIATPTIVLLVVGLGSIYIFYPLGSYLSGGLSWLVDTIIRKGGIFVGAILSGTFLPLVMTGLHRVLTPIEVSLLDKTGLDALRPILSMAGAGQVGAGIAIYCKTKSKRLKKIIGSSLPVGMLGVGEPLMFGVTLPLGKPFLTACLGSIFGGAYVSLMNVSSIGIGLSGLPLMLLIPSNKIIHYIIGTLLAYAGGFVLTYFAKWSDMVDEDKDEEENNVLSQTLHI